MVMPLLMWGGVKLVFHHQGRRKAEGVSEQGAKEE
jgi:hypothetical protein